MPVGSIAGRPDAVMRRAALRYALAPACTLLAALIARSPIGPVTGPGDWFMLSVLGAAWFGGIGPGLVAAMLATLTVSQLAPSSDALFGGFLDLPRLATFSAAGLAVGWWSLRRSQVQSALRISEERYALAMEAAGDGHVDWNLQTGEHYISPRLLQICGHAPGTTFRDRAEWARRFPFHPQDREKWERAIAANFAGRESRFKMDLRIVVEGEVRWTAFHFLLTRDAAGAPLRWTGTIADISEAKRVEAALRDSEQRYALVVNASDEAFWDWRPEGDDLYVSPRFLEMYDLPADMTFKGRAALFQHWPILSPDREGLERAVADHFAGKTERMESEFRVRVRGEIRWSHATGRVTRNAQGEVLRWNGSIRDVTARRLVEEALRASETRYERVVAAAGAGFWDGDLVADTYYVSPRLLDMTGLPRDTTFTGQGEFDARLPMLPEDLENWQQAIQALFASDESRLSMVLRMKLAGAIRWYRADGMCFRDATGTVVRWTGSAIDITDLKRAEEALRESEERYSVAMEASESGYWDWHIPTDTYLTSPRAYELAGFPAGTTWANRDDYRARINMHPDDFARWEAARAALFAGTGERLMMEARYFVHGMTRWFMLHAICKRDASGQVVRWTGSTTDITERKQAEADLAVTQDRLRQAQRLEAMGSLAGGIAHDFNNILAAILGYGEMATRATRAGTQLRRDLTAIMVAGERGRALVERVLAFSRSSVCERVAVNVQSIVREAADLLAARLTDAFRIDVDLRAGDAAILGDETQVHQVVMNLGTNAAQAMPDGGPLSIGLRVAHVDRPRTATIGDLGIGDYLVLAVTDAGHGMPAETIERIFDPFFTTKPVGSGTGLGLSLVHGIVAQLGGAIDVASQLGAGSTFTVYLPRSGDTAPRALAVEPSMPRGAGQCVLIADDEAQLAELAARTVERLGYTAVSCTSAAAALAAISDRSRRFDALLTDERMPGMSGCDLARQVRGLRRTLPILVMSGYVGGGLRERASAAGADDVLRKPLSAADLARRLAQALQKH